MSPRTREGASPTSAASKSPDYFSVKPGAGRLADSVAFLAPGGGTQPSDASSPASSRENAVSPDDNSDSRRSSKNACGLPGVESRKSSVASVSFRQPRNPSLPQGNQRKTDARRLRESSPPAVR